MEVGDAARVVDVGQEIGPLALVVLGLVVLGFRYAPADGTAP
ncbi:MAG: hypothetical protein ACYS0D_01710 [Planctomycetota bacterium]